MGLKIGFVKASLGGVHCFLPASASDADEFARIGFDGVYTAEFKKMRNWKYHKRFFSMINFVFENMDDAVKERRNINTIEGMLIDLKILVGHYELFVTFEGKSIYKPKSVNFASMDQIAFEKFYKDCYNVIYAYYLPMDYHDLEQAVLRLNGYESR